VGAQGFFSVVKPNWGSSSGKESIGLVVSSNGFHWEMGEIVLRID